MASKANIDIDTFVFMADYLQLFYQYNIIGDLLSQGI
jgi:hypothetical protein